MHPRQSEQVFWRVNLNCQSTPVLNEKVSRTSLTLIQHAFPLFLAMSIWIPIVMLSYQRTLLLRTRKKSILYTWFRRLSQPAPPVMIIEWFALFWQFCYQYSFKFRYLLVFPCVAWSFRIRHCMMLIYYIDAIYFIVATSLRTYASCAPLIVLF